ncbi:hypothetical protein ACLOJK_022495 [Asimina triloba]
MDHVPTPGQKGVFEGSNLYALKRKTKRLGQYRSCLRESCPGLVSHCGTTFEVYYYSRNKHSLRKGLQGMSKPTGWVETPCLIASVPSSGKGLSYPVNQTEEQSDEKSEYGSLSESESSQLAQLFIRDNMRMHHQRCTSRAPVWCCTIYMKSGSHCCRWRSAITRACCRCCHPPDCRRLTTALLHPCHRRHPTTSMKTTTKPSAAAEPTVGECADGPSEPFIRPASSTPSQIYRRHTPTPITVATRGKFTSSVADELTSIRLRCMPFSILTKASLYPNFYGPSPSIVSARAPTQLPPASCLMPTNAATIARRCSSIARSCQRPTAPPASDRCLPTTPPVAACVDPRLFHHDRRPRSSDPR